MSESKKTVSVKEVDATTLGYESALAELETIIARIEGGDVALDESLRQYRRGAELVKRCREVLDQARAEVQRIAANDLAERAEAVNASQSRS
ncbi:MAG: exodeoxyribonuclease VII small subunit [Phycisphaerales bacterium]|nr:exodeoxyribonuclease VII small subunit [Phycisphaerales bacterium]